VRHRGISREVRPHHHGISHEVGPHHRGISREVHSYRHGHGISRRARTRHRAHSADTEQWHTLADPIDPRFLTEAPFGTRSFWIQPWRAYLDTWPASRILDALGADFDATPAEADGVAQLLHNSGFTQARVEISWNQLSFADPTRFVDEQGVRATLTALREHGLRPLILLNANSGDPTPSQSVTLTTLRAAPAGSGTVTLDPASAALVAPGRTGFDGLGFGGDPDVLVTSLAPSGVATLSRPLSAPLPAGAHPATTLLYAPFGPPQLPGGAPNPAFGATLSGWLSYVGTVAREAQSVLGPGGFDLEVWNELSFGSQFLDAGSYYAPPREAGAGDTDSALLAATAAYVRDPANGIAPGVEVSDGFASETPFVAPSQLPAGVSALSKHLYPGALDFPAQNVVSSIEPLDALGAPDFADVRPGASLPRAPFFVPAYRSFLPEYFLTDTQTETEIRDLAPITTDIYGTPHGRYAASAGGVRPQTWMTEYNIEPSGADPSTPTAAGAPPASTLAAGAPSPSTLAAGAPPPSPLTAADARHLQAKALLRSLVAMVAKGMTRVYFYAPLHAGSLDFVQEAFGAALDAEPARYPGDALGGETTTGLARLLDAFRGPGPGGAARQLQLRSISQLGGHAQFSGDGTAAHPDLYDRDVLAVFPFQSSPTRFVIPVYVMTRNLATLYRPAEPAGDIARYDLPDEQFRVKLGGLPTGSGPPTVSAYDPLRNSFTPARLLSEEGGTAAFQLAATDYPRLLTLEYGHG
jgi:hypothetical protein